MTKIFLGFLTDFNGRYPNNLGDRLVDMDAHETSTKITRMDT